MIIITTERHLTWLLFANKNSTAQADDDDYEWQSDGDGSDYYFSTQHFRFFSLRWICLYVLQVLGIRAVVNAIKVFECCIQVVSFWLRTISIFLPETFFHLGLRFTGEFYDVRVLCFYAVWDTDSILICNWRFDQCCWSGCFLLLRYL